MELDLLDSEMLLFNCVCTLVLLYTHPRKDVQGKPPQKNNLGCLLANSLWAHGIGWPKVYSHGNYPIKGKHYNMVVHYIVAL